MRQASPLACLLLAAALAACSSVEAVREEGGRVGSGSSFLPGAPGYVAAPPAVQLTAAGLGSIGAETGYSKPALQQALPNFTFDTVKTMSEGELKWLLAAFKDGLQQIQFEPDRAGRRIVRMHIVGQEAAGPNGERLGMTFTETDGARLSCSPGRGEWSGMALCGDAQGALIFIYAPPEYAGSDGATREARPAPNARLVRIVWQAPAGR